MLTFSSSNSRRDFLKVGALSIGGLTLGDLLQIQAREAVRPKSLKSIIMVYLHGGPSQLDMFDMKPDAPAEYRGVFQPIRTKVPGLDICELLPKLATITDKMSVIRNMTFNEYREGHNPPLVYTGYYNSTSKPSHRPTFGSVVSKLRGRAVPDLPPYVAFDGYDDKPVRSVDYLGVAHRPFAPTATKMSAVNMPIARMADRAELLRSLDSIRRGIDDDGGNMAAMDAFNTRALDLLAGTRAGAAFNINLEPEKVRAMYGKEGAQFLQARRLVEAGVQVVTLTDTFESTTWDRAGAWDHHHNIYNGNKSLRYLLPALDKSLYALITDLDDRGLSDDVAVVVWGEMGRTPKMNSTGRDHWTDVGFALVAGGGLKMGQVIGATTSRAEKAVGRPYTPKHMLATLYHNVLGIDPSTTIPGFDGRPLALLDSFDKINELV